MAKDKVVEQVVGLGEWKVGAEITPEMVVDLQAKEETISLQEETLKAQVEKIAELEGAVKDKNKIIADSQGVIDDYKEIVSDKDAMISECQKLLEEQKEEVVRLLKEQVELNKLISDGVIDNHGLQIRDNEDLVVIRFLLSPAGRFKLPYNVGQEVALHKEVAAEIVEAMYAEYVE